MGESKTVYFALLFPWFLTRGVTTHLFGFLTFLVLYPPLAYDGHQLKLIGSDQGVKLTGIPQGLTGSTLPFDFPRPPP